MKWAVVLQVRKAIRHNVADPKRCDVHLHAAHARNRRSNEQAAHTEGAS